MGTFNPAIKKTNRLSPFYIFTISAFLLSIVFFFINMKLSLIILLFYIIFTAAAPFMIGTGFFLPVITRGSIRQMAVALTFDDGPDPNATPLILKLLAEHSAKATFFVTGENASKSPDIIKMILKDNHSIGNHSLNHYPLLMLRSKKKLFNEIKSTQDILKGFGIIPLIFRPPAGITNPMLRGVLNELNLFCINWSCRAFDAGNRRINGLAEKILQNVKAGDIILLHDVIPGGRNDVQLLFNEVDAVLNGLKNRGYTILPLSDLLGFEIMKRYVP